MAIDKAVDSGALDAMFTDIGNAIREKDGTTALIPPGEMPAKIRAIQTGTDTSDATVTAGDLPKGVVAYGSGGKVTGTVTETKSGKTWNCGNPFNQADSGRLIMASPFGAVAQRTVDADVMLRAGATVDVAVPLSTLGDATAADVAKGKTFASAAGVAVVGTREGLGDAVWVIFLNETSNAVTFILPAYNDNGGAADFSMVDVSGGGSAELQIRAGSVVTCIDPAFAGGTLHVTEANVTKYEAINLVTFVVPSEPLEIGDNITVTITQG